MLRLKKYKKESEGLAIPESEPVTLIEVSSENLPYGCQCPLCGGIFQIPQSTLYKLEDDNIQDIDSDTEVLGPRSGPDNEVPSMEGAPEVDAEFTQSSEESAE